MKRIGPVPSRYPMELINNDAYHYGYPYDPNYPNSYGFTDEIETYELQGDPAPRRR